MLVLRPWELADFDSGFGDGVKAFGLGRFVAIEEAVDGVVLFDVAAGELEEDDGAAEVEIEGVRGVGQFRVGGDDVKLGFFGGFEDFSFRGSGGEVDGIGRGHLVVMTRHGVGDSGSEVSDQKKSHGAGMVDA